MTILIAAAALGACAQQAPAPAMVAVDTAAVNAGLAGVRAKYIAAETAGDAAAVAALYFPTGGIDYAGAPTMMGRDAVQAGMTAAWAARGHPEMAHIVPTSTNPYDNSNATEIGTYHNMGKLNGKGTHEWGRYLISLSKDTDGSWKINYLMAFADSTKTDK